MLTLKELKHLYRNPYAWPGGYPHFLLTSDGGTFCHSCVKSEYREFVQAIHENGAYNTGWEPEAYAVNWESLMYCDHCGKQIEAAYEVQKE